MKEIYLIFKLMFVLNNLMQMRYPWAPDNPRIYPERLCSRSPAIASTTPAPAATPKTKPTRKPQGRSSDVQPNMADRAIPVPAIEARADPSEIFCCVFILFLLPISALFTA